MRLFREYVEQLMSWGFGRLGKPLAAFVLFGLLAAAGCSHSSSNPADKDRPAAPPANAIAQIQSNPQMSPAEKQTAINAITAAQTRASGQMTVAPHKDSTGM